MLSDHSRVIYAYGSIYDGEFKEDKRIGIGILLFTNGGTEEGE